MKNNKIIILTLTIVLVVLMPLLSIVLRHKCITDGENVIERRDTLFYTDTISVKDTIFCHNSPKPYKVFVRDTVFLRGERDTLLREEKMYRDSTYMAWVSGIDVSLDSIEVYTNTKYITTIQREVVKESVKTPSDGLFLVAGINTHDGRFIPSVGLNFVQKRIIYGAVIGASNKKPYLGVNVGYKLK